MEPSYICRLSKYNRWNRLGREIVGYSRVHMVLVFVKKYSHFGRKNFMNFVEMAQMPLLYIHCGCKTLN